jgi:NADH pyrophosphatase NudC (nudix superfamily)
MHHVSWYKMPSGRYEITAYMSHGKNIADQGGWKHLGQGEQTQATSATVSGDEVRADAPVVQTPDTILAALAERNRVTLVTVREMNPKPPTVDAVLASLKSDGTKAGAKTECCPECGGKLEHEEQAEGKAICPGCSKKSAKVVEACRSTDPLLTVGDVLASLAEDKLNKILALSSQAAARR